MSREAQVVSCCIGLGWIYPCRTPFRVLEYLPSNDARRLHPRAETIQSSSNNHSQQKGRLATLKRSLQPQFEPSLPAPLASRCSQLGPIDSGTPSCYLFLNLECPGPGLGSFTYNHQLESFPNPRLLLRDLSPPTRFVIGVYQDTFPEPPNLASSEERPTFSFRFSTSP